MNKKFLLTLVIVAQWCGFLHGKFFIPGKEIKAIENGTITAQQTCDSKLVICVMLPKCGTHLLCKCIAYFGDPLMRYGYESRELTKESILAMRSLNTQLPPHHFKGRYDVATTGPVPMFLVQKIGRVRSNLFWTHYSYTPQFDAYLDCVNATKFLMIRDPRAMVVSEAFMIQRGYEHGQFIELEPLLLDLIDGRKKNYIPWGVEVHECYPVIWEMGICAYYKSFLPFMQSKNCVTVRFEDLVGSMGGGSAERQADVIMKVAQHIGKNISKEQARQIGQEMFGGTGTFREGSIDGWKKHFTPAVKQAFKAVPGANELLIALGYEKDSLW